MSLFFSFLFFCVLALPVRADEGAFRVVSARPAADFLESIGVNSSISRRGELLDKTIEICKYLGVRWVRSGYEGNIPVDDQIALFRNAGVKTSYGLLSGGSDIPRLLEGARKLASAGALLAVEGNNEPNNWGVTYRGEKGGGKLSWLPVARLQADLYAAVKGDEMLKTYPVWSISENGAQTDNVGLQFLTIPEGAGTLLPAGTRFADYANCHNYIEHPSFAGLHHNQTWLAASPGRDCPIDGLFGNYGTTWARKFAGYSETALETLPRVTTETGLTIKGDITEEKHARLLLNLFLAQYARGWKHTALYLLRDRSDESGNQQFGFYKPDYTPRRAALYMHNLTTILADNPTAGKRRAAAAKSLRQRELSYSIDPMPETVHELLLQKSDGSFVLVVWGERVSGSDTVKVTFAKAPKQIVVFDPIKGTHPDSVLRNATELSLTLSDYPLILQL
ncbi:MAG: glycosyl hydrolase [Bacteroidales bacterium]